MFREERCGEFGKNLQRELWRKLSGYGFKNIQWVHRLA